MKELICDPYQTVDDGELPTPRSIIDNCNRLIKAGINFPFVAIIALGAELAKDIEAAKGDFKKPKGIESSSLFFGGNEPIGTFRSR